MSATVKVVKVHVSHALTCMHGPFGFCQPSMVGDNSKTLNPKTQNALGWVVAEFGKIKYYIGKEGVRDFQGITASSDGKF